MNIYRHELRSLRVSAMIWAGSLSALTVVFFTIFTSFSQDAEAALSVISNLPKPVLDALDISPDTFFSVYGFYAYLLNFIMLAGAVQAMNLGVGVLARDEIGKTADFLLTKPVSRRHIVTSKLLAALTIILITNLTFYVASFASAIFVATSNLNVATFILVCLPLLIIQLIFLSIGLIASQLVRRIKSTTALSLPVVFGFFIIGMLGAIIGNEASRYISPFKFFDFSHIIATNSYEPAYLAVGLAIILISVPLSYRIYIHKDIRAPA